MRTLGLLKPKKSLVAVFTEGCSAQLTLLGRRYNLSESGITASAYTIAPLIHSFLLKRGEEVILSFRYWFAEMEDYWPEQDIFPFIARITRDSPSKECFVRIWKEHMAGRDITRQEFLDELQTIQR